MNAKGEVSMFSKEEKSLIDKCLRRVAWEKYWIENYGTLKQKASQDLLLYDCTNSKIKDDGSVIYVPWEQNEDDSDLLIRDSLLALGIKYITC